MERLTKKEKLKLSHGEELIICKHDDSDCNDSCMSMQPCKWYKKVQEKLWEYEDAEEQGLLPKFHLGDEFWTTKEEAEQALAEMKGENYE